MSKCATLLLIAVLTLSIPITVESASAQLIPKPPAPEFTLKVVAHPYDVPPKYEIDPYTGKNVTTEWGYHVENKSIEVTVKNQPFSPYKDTNGNVINLYYNVSVKGHYEGTWDYCFNNSYRGLLNASGSDYTSISMPIGHHMSVPSGGYPLEGVDTGDRVDFRVAAQIGYYDKEYTGMLGMWIVGGEMDYYYVFTGETSDWSNTQTVTIPTFTPLPMPTTNETSQTLQPTSTPLPMPTTNETSQTLQSVAIMGTIIALVVVSVVLLVYFKKRKHER